MKDSKIEWTDHTVNLWWGCTEVHAGCNNCYARVLDNRYNQKTPHWGTDRPRLLIKSSMEALSKYQAQAAANNENKRVFVGSMMDIFEKPFPVVNRLDEALTAPVFNLHEELFGKIDAVEPMTTDYLRHELFKNIMDGNYPNLIFLFLTKRPGNINKYMPAMWVMDGAPDNVFFGTSISDQPSAKKFIVELAKVNAKTFVSIEPQLAAIDLTEECFSGGKSYGKMIDHINWAICGGESGPGKRPYNTDWARKIMADCAEHKVAFFMKQVDKVWPIPDDLMVRQFPE